MQERAGEHGVSCHDGCLQTPVGAKGLQAGSRATVFIVADGKHTGKLTVYCHANALSHVQTLISLHAHLPQEGKAAGQHGRITDLPTHTVFIGLQIIGLQNAAVVIFQQSHKQGSQTAFRCLHQRSGIGNYFFRGKRAEELGAVELGVAFREQVLIEYRVIGLALGGAQCLPAAKNRA